MPDVLTSIIPHLQLSKFLEDNKDTLVTTVQSALETADANLQWLEKYCRDMSAWLRDHSHDAASYLSFNPYMSIIVILSGYLINKY